MVAAVDSSGNGRDGTYDTLVLGSPAPTTFVSGLLPAGGDLACALADFTPPGTAETFVLIPDVPSPDVAWSFECWVQLADVKSPLPDSWLFYANDSMAFIDLRISTGSGGFISVNDWSVSASDLGDFDPHYLVITYDGSVVRVFVDAVELTVDTVGSAIGASSFDLSKLGGFGSGRTFYGTLDEAAWYTTALTSGQISAHSAAATSSFAAYTAAVLADSPWAYYHLNDKSGGWHVGNVGIG